ncbi:bifunctional pyr operon transcriptional regulator/uracil phosphoribosyltransferase PyrR [Derxia gummosa]|uniref:Bifunctional pyr operon transcriptional regulator/uracil phosphoribosyltransferase PyrR n=1 Tax=Derxia gummosa DSM 723 TaxID=1121388 RepID=A0A8B6X2E2_9BURK|nr:bifunctional pyr operon transcriptional regulator/uracil phosphoribosyltransferase PyrR [Derxia gummosa]
MSLPESGAAIDADAAYRALRNGLAARLARLGASSPAFIGIHSGGAWLAERLARDLGVTDLGFLDISFYRDDFSRVGLHPQVLPTAIPFALDDRVVVLVDDVLYTGRTIRAAMNAIFDFGRPERIELAVLFDRHAPASTPDTRELPVAPSVTGAVIELPAGAHLRLSRAGDGFAATLDAAAVSGLPAAPAA